MAYYIGFHYNGRRYCMDCAKKLDSIPVDEKGRQTLTTLMKPVERGEETETAECSECGTLFSELY